MALFDQEAEILKNEQAGSDCFRMELLAPEIARAALPGQFVMVRPGNGTDPLLRRPFSIHDVPEQEKNPDRISLLVKTKGRGTGMLSQMRQGEKIFILGPLGRGFQTAPGTERACLVAGGIGVAPLVFLARSLKRQGLGENSGLVLLGGRTREDVLCSDLFSSMGMEVRAATEDGGLGERGLVTALLEKALRSGEVGQVFTCGPEPMLKAVAVLARDAKTPCQVSLETSMACGMGACLGCALEGPGGKILHVCKDGPVLDTKSLGF